MADAVKEAINNAADTGHEWTDNLSEQLDAMRKEIASITDAVAQYGSDTLGGVRHNAVALAKEAQHQSAVVARQVGRQANAASKKIQDNPVETIIILGAIALISAMIFKRD